MRIREPIDRQIIESDYPRTALRKGFDGDMPVELPPKTGSPINHLQEAVVKALKMIGIGKQRQSKSA